MGWCSATDIFDDIMDAVIEFVPEEKVDEVVLAIATPLWDGDWDCEQESKYFMSHLLEPMRKNGMIVENEYQWLKAGGPDDWDWDNKPF